MAGIQSFADSVLTRLFGNRFLHFLFENSLFLFVGATSALIFANVNYEAYHALVDPYHFFVNEVLMALFFFLAAKEIREAVLPGASLSGRKAFMPLFATAGGMIGPIALFVIGAILFAPHLIRGWAVPTATDIAFSYIFAKIIFRNFGLDGHPAIKFLLLLAIADDAGGLLILAIFYPQHELNLLSFGVFVGLAVLLSLFLWKKLEVVNPAFYLPCGILAWVGFSQGGIHPALALVPLAWCMPHEKDDQLGPFGELEDGHQMDTLNQAERWLKNPVELILFGFGFVNAGVPIHFFNSFGIGAWLVFFGLLIGKPVGIFFLSILGMKLFKLSLPEGMTRFDLLLVGMVAGVGFTVAIFVSTVAFEPGYEQNTLKLGALMSLVSGVLALGLSRLKGARTPEHKIVESHSEDLVKI